MTIREREGAKKKMKEKMDNHKDKGNKKKKGQNSRKKHEEYKEHKYEN